MSKEPVRPAVWAVTIAVAFSYMGVGVVDPILPEISSALKASPGQTELLFSTYLFVSAALMFFASWVATRIGRKKTLLVGLAVIATFALVAWPFPRHGRSHDYRPDRHRLVRPAYTDQAICTPLGSRTIPCPCRFAGVDPHVGSVGLQLWLLHPVGVRAFPSR